ncbi:MAG: response regulator transcription factor [Nitrospinota bacterium]|nr:response regulator transcription factor [Nitrospinota bacterium]
MRRLLLVEDDNKLAVMLAEYLGGRDFSVSHAATLAEAERLLERQQFDIVALDLTLPDGDGVEFCRRLRVSSSIPVVMLTARGDDMDKVVGLEIGADDYLSKPFDPRELVARLRAVLRRTASAPTTDGVGEMRFADVVLDLDAMEAYKDGTRRDITPRQFAILQALVERPGRVLSREALMDMVKGQELEAFDRSIDVHISRIRAAIEDDPKNPALIKTVRGEGYIFTGAPKRERKSR